MKEILNFLTKDENIKHVYKLAEEVGYNNVRIFKSPLAVDEEQFNFLVSVDKKYRGKITLGNSGLLQWKLGKLLGNNNFTIVQDDELDAQFKDEILADAISLAAENMPKIVQLWGFQDLKPALSKDPKLSIQGKAEIVNVIISIPKMESSSDEESSREYYIDCALEYLTNVKRQKHEKIAQTTLIIDDKKKLSI